MALDQARIGEVVAGQMEALERDYEVVLGLMRAAEHAHIQNNLGSA
jgi:hypothetical protein